MRGPAKKGKVGTHNAPGCVASLQVLLTVRRYCTVSAAAADSAIASAAKATASSFTASTHLRHGR